MKKLTTITIILILMQGTQYLSAQSWKLTGNAGTATSTNFIGTTDNVAFKIRTNNAVRMTISSSGKIGIGTASPQDKFHVNGTGNLARFGTGTTATTYNYWSTGNDVGSFIEQQGNTAIAGSDKFKIQSSKSGLHNDYSQFIIDPNNGFTFTSLGTGNTNVGIGDFSPGYKFYVTAAPVFATPVTFIENTLGNAGADGLYIKAGSNTNIGAFFIAFRRPDGTQIGLIMENFVTGVSYATTSDKRLKNIIGASQKGLSDLMKINIYDYTFKSDPDKKIQTGFMAQELYDIFPQSVCKPRENNEPAEKNPWMVDYGSVTPLIIKSVQEQQQMIDELKKSNDDLKKQNENLQSGNEAMKNDIAAMKSRMQQFDQSLSQCCTQSSMNDGVIQVQTSDSKVQTPLLGQNIPNPFGNSAIIPFHIPKDCIDASIMITNTATSEVISVIPISCNEDHVSIEAGALASGTYSYSLYVDGRLIDSRSMILTR